ncbi:MAG: hypothetical protein OHK93_000895 [Ramalina farinacea]|uniref:FAD-binding FR-type domain-containing protein n=1 Tax=Ramalina farinacea TaxID=258253 RepID=A0AA43QPF9_9LECA|nr:hypothetical protein [Ramalina farinacea]
MEEWHDGVDKMHKLMNVPDRGDPTKPGLSAHAQRLLHMSSLLAIGTTDDEGRPWTTLLGGEQGFARSLGQSIVGVRALADSDHDPVLRTLLAQPRLSTPGEYETAREFSALGIHLASRDRVKLQGRLLGGSRVGNESILNTSQDEAIEVQMALAIEGSLGNCPKYLNKKDIVLAVPQPVPLPATLPLSQPALDLLAKADTIFITSHHPSHMSTNHRGGPPGFIRVECNDSQSVILAYPEYSGNRLYQTLGNLILDPRAGIVVPDFDTGNVLYISGTTKIIFGKDASRLLPRSNLAVQIRVDAAKFVHKGLGFRGLPGQRSPYNPPVRYLTTERPATNPDSPTTSTATLLSRTLLTPTIARFRFRLSEPANHAWTAGQYVALSFEDELSGGYAHSDDEDPRSLNDDYVRTFTVSSPPPPSCASRHHQAGMAGGRELAKEGRLPPVPNDEFEITIRNVGTVTRFLFNTNIRAGLAVPLRGFGGSFAIKQDDAAKGIITPFVAGGIGITPLLAQLPSLDLSRLLVLWTVNSRDVGLVVDTMRRHPGLGKRMRVFVSGEPLSKSWGAGEIDGEAIPEGVFERRRMVREVIVGMREEVGDTWYICAGTGLRKQLLEWLEGKTAVYEDFDY